MINIKFKVPLEPEPTVVPGDVVEASYEGTTRFVGVIQSEGHIRQIGPAIVGGHAGSVGGFWTRGGSVRILRVFKTMELS